MLIVYMYHIVTEAQVLSATLDILQMMWKKFLLN